jgi:hypothetical protein
MAEARSIGQHCVGLIRFIALCGSLAEVACQEAWSGKPDSCDIRTSNRLLIKPKGCSRQLSGEG